MRSTGNTRPATGVGPPSCLAVRGNLRPLHIYTSDRTPPFGAARPPRGKVHTTQPVHRSPLTGGLSTDKGLPSIQASRQQALGRSRGGLTTKLHTICDGRGRNLATRLTPGQDADTSELVGLVDAVRVARPGSRGRPRVRPDHLTGDKAY